VGHSTKLTSVADARVSAALTLSRRLSRYEDDVVVNDAAHVQLRLGPTWTWIALLPVGDTKRALLARRPGRRSSNRF
jgi:hypothetical protein